MAEKKDTKAAAEKTTAAKSTAAKDPAVPDAEFRNRADQQTTDPVTLAAQEAAPDLVARAADAIKTAAAAQPAQRPSGDGSFDQTPTATQIVEEARKPLDPKGSEELKIVRTGSHPDGPVTTLKEEVRMVPENAVSGDEEKDANTAAVLAKTQGINQIMGDKVIGQDGKEIASVDKIEGDIPESAKEAAKA